MNPYMRLKTQAELIQKQEEYIAFLSKHLNQAQQFCYIHGWVCRKEDAEEGIRFRTHIKILKESL